MGEFEQMMQKAVETGAVLGCVVAARDKSGRVIYDRAFGQRQAVPEAKPMELDTVFMLASLTKLMTTIAVLQLVEEGLVGLDDDVTHLLLVLGRQPILVDVTDGDVPITRKRRKTITLRLLLDHSSGAGYDFLHPAINQYRRYCNMPIGLGSTVEDMFNNPLLHEPGEGWAYGCGVDWAGKIVEGLSGLSLEEYMKKHIWDRLGTRDVTFWPDRRPDMTKRLASMTIRDRVTAEAVQSRKPFRMDAGLKDACGGQGAFGTITDYVQMLHSILVDDERLLKKQTTAAMFLPGLSAAAKKALLADLEVSSWAVGHYPPTGEYDWGLGGLLVDGDKHPNRRRGTMLWGGNANLSWFLDRTSGLCGVFGCQLLPPGDKQVEALMEGFESDMYRLLHSRTSRL